MTTQCKTLGQKNWIFLLFFFSFLIMLKFIQYFLISISLYFIWHTILVFGIFDGQYKEIISSLKELIWLGFVATIILSNRSRFKAYIQKTKIQVLILGLFVILGLITTYFNIPDLNQFIKNTIIGLKYGWYFMFVFWSAGLAGFILFSQTSKEKFVNNYINWLQFLTRLSWFILIGGLLIQGTKVIFPELWYQLGFGGLNIYKQWIAPPLYYLTQHDGIMRLSGLFSGPNNFAFWIIGLFPFLWAMRLRKDENKWWLEKAWLLLLSVLNLGRVLLVWIGTFFGILAAKSNWIKNNKFISGIIIGGIVGFFGYITFLKWDSTTEHFTLWLEALQAFLNKPWWYGLGSSGPGIHWNGSLLPENYYLQIALDYGRLWPVLFALFWTSIFGKIKKMQYTKSVFNQSILLFSTGFVCMLVAGIFLHVFEDSMVNYLFFIPWGIAYGARLSEK